MGIVSKPMKESTAACLLLGCFLLIDLVAPAWRPPWSRLPTCDWGPPPRGYTSVKGKRTTLCAWQGWSARKQRQTGCKYGVAEKDPLRDEGDAINEKLGCVVEDMTSYRLNTIEGRGIVTTTWFQQECADHAASVPGGLFWTWNNRTWLCLVKTSKAGRIRMPLDKYWAKRVSGNKECGCIIDEATDYSGNDIRRKRTNSQKECADYSASSHDGIFWTWSKYSRMCYVKSSKAGKRYVRHAVSGNRRCGGDKLCHGVSQY